MFDYKAIVDRVVDGDTIKVTISLGFGISYKETVRFADIDAYETSLRRGTTEAQKVIGLEGKQFLKELLEGKEVLLTTHKDKGKYGRYVADVCINIDNKEVNVNQQMVKDGYAVYKSY